MPSGKKLKVLMVSTSYPQNDTDWRGLFIQKMAHALADEVHLQLWAPPGVQQPGVEYACLSTEAAWLEQLAQQGGIAHILRQGQWPQRLHTPLKLLKLLRDAYCRHSGVDLVHVNWLQNALPLLGLPQPALITVLGSDLGLLTLPGMVPLLRQVLKKRPCVLAPNAQWMVPILTQYFGDIAQITPIIFGIDPAWYALVRRWPAEPRQWLVVSRLTAHKIGPLFEWGAPIFQGKQDELHLFGPQQEAMKIPDWVYYHGPTYPQALQQDWFPKATALISVSQHDEGRPQVMLEAMAAGLPILASNLPAHADLIAHQQTGYLVNHALEFQAGVAWLSQPLHNASVSWQAKHWVKANVGTWQDCARRYVTSYESLVVSSSSHE